MVHLRQRLLSPSSRSRKSPTLFHCVLSPEGRECCSRWLLCYFQGGLFSHHQRNEEHCIESQQSSTIAHARQDTSSGRTKKSRPTLGEKAPACGQSCPATRPNLLGHDCWVILGPVAEARACVQSALCLVCSWGCGGPGYGGIRVSPSSWG